MLHVAHETRLVDGHHRAESHGHGRELPEIRHQPGVRVRRQPAAADLAAEARELVFRQAPLEECARIDTGRGMPLHEHHVTGMPGFVTAPEMIETDLVHRGRRGIAGQVPAVLGADAVRPHDHRHRVPAQIGLDTPFERAVARVFRLPARGDRVDVGRVRGIRQVGSGAARKVDHAVQQEVRPLGPVVREYRVDRLQPLVRFYRIDVVVRVELGHVSSVVAGPGVARERGSRIA